MWGDGDILGQPGRYFCEPNKDTFRFVIVEQLFRRPSVVSIQVDGEKGK